jgi:hypothetical protein
LKKNDSTFFYTFFFNDVATTEIYTGTIESKDAMKGKVQLGDVGNGTFTARRQ